MKALLWTLCLLLVPAICSAQDQTALGVFLTVWADGPGECRHRELVDEFNQGLDRLGTGGSDRAILVEPMLPRVSPGVYFARLEAEGRTGTAKLVIVR